MVPAALPPPNPAFQVPTNVQSLKKVITLLLDVLDLLYHPNIALCMLLSAYSAVPGRLREMTSNVENICLRHPQVITMNPLEQDNR